MRLAVLFLVCVLAAGAQKFAIRGVYSDPKPLWQKGLRLDELGINAVFVHSGSISRELIERARAEGAEVYAEFATLNGKGYVEMHPEAWPINEKGQRAPPATWFLGACPTEPGFRAYRLEQLARLLDQFPVAGVWMDYFHWHAQFEDPKPVLPETFFNPTCIVAFETATGVRAPGIGVEQKAHAILTRYHKQWRNWRAEVLAGWARDIRTIVKQKRPGALLGVYHCPWKDDEYNRALRRTLGFDFNLIAAEVDVFSPMVYHGRMGRPPEWPGQFTLWLSRRLPASIRIWPIVQAHGDPRPITPAEFRTVMSGAMRGGASGIMMFTTRAVAEDPAKIEVLRELYRRESR